jgi:hypothetical protein
MGKLAVTLDAAVGEGWRARYYVRTKGKTAWVMGTWHQLHVVRIASQRNPKKTTYKEIDKSYP